MCGLAGFATPPNTFNQQDLGFLKKSLKHRGPDGHGHWINQERSVGLVHTRLSILDLSENAAQPMQTSDGSGVISYNGEVYNYQHLKKIYKKDFLSEFSSSGDTQLILKLLEIFSFKKSIKMLDGMFAIAFYDQKSKKIYLARDKFGEKPLFYFFDGQSFCFASEVDALRSLSFLELKIDEDAIKNYLGTGYFVNQKTIYKNVFSVPPGTVLEFDIQNKKIEIIKYWDSYNQDFDNTNEAQNDEVAIKELENLIENSVQSRLISDVPVGCFLSSGTDSSLISAIASKFSKKKINTFTIGFEEKKWDESKSAKEIASIIGTDHHELIIGSKNILESVVDAINLYDMPLSDPSTIPTTILSKFAASNVKVCLSGDGGDELFSGYERYKQTIKFNYLPIYLRKILANTLNFVDNHLKIHNQATDKILKLKLPLSANSFEECYALLNMNPSKSDKDFYESILKDFAIGEHGSSKKFNRNQCMQLLDINSYLPNNILTKVDRAAMHYSLETRAPFLNPEIFNYCFNTVNKKKYDFFYDKKPLKKILSKYLPQQYVYSPKKGFSVPIIKWLRGPLKEWGNELIHNAENSSIDNLLINDLKIMWKEHQDGSRNWHSQLWSYLVLLEWLNKKQML